MIAHIPGSAEPIYGREAHGAAMQQLVRIFPDIQVQLPYQIQFGDATPPLVLAHRGAWDQAPQNSVAAIRRAAALGCDGVEIDVRRTADGRLVVIHDARLRWRPVRRLTHAAAQARMAPGQAPPLGDVLDAAAAAGLLVDVEFKEDGYVEEALGISPITANDKYATPFNDAFRDAGQNR